MKQVTLRTATEVKNPQFFPQGLTTNFVLTAACEFTPQTGVTTAETRSRFKLIDVIQNNKSTKELLLEDADYNKLVELVNQVQWLVPEKFFVTVEDDLLNAKTVDPNNKK